MLAHIQTVAGLPMVPIPGGIFNGQRIESFLLAQTPVANAQYVAHVDRHLDRPYILLHTDPDSHATSVLCRARTPDEARGILAERFPKDNGVSRRPHVLGVFTLFPLRKDISFYVEYDSPNQPVVNISWFHAFEYCVGNGLFLPTDAQWRYAAGGPEGYRYGTRSGGLNRKEAHYRSMVSAEIGSYPPNGFGLRDMTGNVWEWMACDPSLGRPYGLRGGCFENHDARFLRSAYREDAFSPAYADVITGFRPAAGL